MPLTPPLQAHLDVCMQPDGPCLLPACHTIDIIHNSARMSGDHPALPWEPQSASRLDTITKLMANQ